MSKQIVKKEIEYIDWRSGSRHKVSIDVAFKALEKIRAKHGGDLRPTDIVEASKSKRAPLHKEFEWNDSIAGNLHRCRQARVITQDIRVVYKKAPAQEVRHYESVTREKTETSKKQQVFRSTEDIMKDPDARAELLSRAIREAQTFRHRYRDLQELAKVFSAFDEFLQTTRAI